VVFGLVGSLQNVAVIISLQIVSPLVPLPVELLELPVLLLVLVAEDVLVVVWAATGDVANSDSTMRDARFISKAGQSTVSRRSASRPLDVSITFRRASVSHIAKN
jgi:hypothetical protein